jgi:hypothetical protein
LDKTQEQERNGGVKQRNEKIQESQGVGVWNVGIWNMMRIY